jgi:hypothetical protein
MTIEDVIRKCNEIHNFKYDYSLITEHINHHTKYKIICPLHGVFEQHMNVHINQKCGCPKCRNEYLTTSQLVPLEVTLSKFKETHGVKYDYSLVNNTPKSREKVKIICPLHGVFEQSVTNHIQGHGCWKCKESKGERIIRVWLEENKIEFEYNKWFSDCRGKRKPLPFDFYLQKFNLLIEFDGEQHFKQYKHFSDTKFAERQLYDSIKTNYCAKKGIQLLRIPYTEFKNVKQILASTLGIGA